ncbi:MAG TPA: right-handed parallel beta-helix repeat-containing protein [Phycisphaerales bacterium]|nr:right-handed parallel beta-helix repeat-containing protein [Phycisphaerales bacterium]
MSFTVAGLAALIACGTALAGELDPPPGPVARSMKTLIDVEPRTAVNSTNTPGDESATYLITRPGSYYLAAPLVGEPGKAGVEIAASHVTLDLRGFEAAGVKGAAAGIRVRSAQSDITVRNGVVSNWPGIGVDTIEAPFTILEDVRASCNDVGIVTTHSSTIRRCVADENNGGGILTGRSNVVADCITSFNQTYGMYVQEACRVDRCLFEGNTNNGLYLDGGGCEITNCTSVNNGLHGIASIYGASISSCTAEHNAANGLWSLGPVAFLNCRCSSNGENGIEAGDNSSVTNCAVRDNLRDGLHLGARVSATGNHATGHAKGAGIRVVGSASRIDGNAVMGNMVGVRVTAEGCFIVRNTAAASATQAFDIAPGNTFGPVISAVGVGDLGAVTGTNHPLANVIY